MEVVDSFNFSEVGFSGCSICEAAIIKFLLY